MALDHYGTLVDSMMSKFVAINSGVEKTVRVASNSTKNSTGVEYHTAVYHTHRSTKDTAVMWWMLVIYWASFSVCPLAIPSDPTVCTGLPTVGVLFACGHPYSPRYSRVQTDQAGPSVRWMCV